MYRLLHVATQAGSWGSQEVTVIAEGFHYSSDARIALATWVLRHFPVAEYQREDASWRVANAGVVHSFTVDTAA